VVHLAPHEPEWQAALLQRLVQPRDERAGHAAAFAGVQLSVECHHDQRRPRLGHRTIVATIRADQFVLGGDDGAPERLRIDGDTHAAAFCR